MADGDETIASDGDETIPTDPGEAETLPTADGIDPHAPTRPADTLAEAGSAPPIEIPSAIGGLANRTLFGPYLIERELGAGGMGRVYLGEHQTLRRRVAIKLMMGELSRRAGYKERFLREARSAASVQHPHLVTVHDAGEIDGQLYMALEFVPGGDVAQLIKQQGRIPIPQALELIRDAAEGLTALEAHGLIHRDIKPNNIFLDANGRAKLGDFGLARSTVENDDQLTMTGATVGTPAYMPPEQARGERDVDHRADIYALGATLFSMITGGMPYRGATPYAIVDQVLNAPQPTLADSGVDAPPAVEGLLARSMAKDRARRYPDCASFIAAIDVALGRRSPDATPATLLEAAPATATAGRGWPLIAGLPAVLLIIIGLAWYLSGSDPAPEGEPNPSAVTDGDPQTPPPEDPTTGGQQSNQQLPSGGTVHIGQNVVIGEERIRQAVAAQGGPGIDLNSVSLEEFIKGWRLTLTARGVPQRVTDLGWRVDDGPWRGITPLHQGYGMLTFQLTLPLEDLAGDHRLAVRWRPVDATQAQVHTLDWNDREQRIIRAQQLLGDGSTIGIFLLGNQLHEGKLWCSLSSSIESAHPGLKSVRYSVDSDAFDQRIRFEPWKDFYSRFPEGWDLLVLPVGTRFLALRCEFIDGSVREYRIENTHRGSQQELMILAAREELADGIFDRADYSWRGWGSWELDCVDSDEVRRVVTRVDYGPEPDRLDRHIDVDPQRSDRSTTTVPGHDLVEGIAFRLTFVDGSHSRVQRVRNDDVADQLLEAKAWAEEEAWISTRQYAPGRWLVQVEATRAHAPSLAALRYGFDSEIPDRELAVAPGQELPDWLDDDDRERLRGHSGMQIVMPPSARQIVMQLTYHDSSTSAVRSWALPAAERARLARDQLTHYQAGDRALFELRSRQGRRRLRLSCLNDRRIREGIAGLTWRSGEAEGIVMVNDLDATEEPASPPSEVPVPETGVIEVMLRFTDGTTASTLVQ